MKPNTCLVVDVWEGQLEIDEAVLKAGGVAGMSIRLNSISGGHHLDDNFKVQWKEAENFSRFPYFVYNPWVDGTANFNWLAANCPPEVRLVSADIEVRKTGYASSTYANEVKKFLALCKTRWKMIIYTGQWFLPYLAQWPKDLDYWWAQYPDHETYFKGVSTWEELKLRLDKLDKPFNLRYMPGPLKMWQFSGDALILPGNKREIDVNIFYGSADDLKAYVNEAPPAFKPKTYYRVLHDVEIENWSYRPRPSADGEVAVESVKIEGGAGQVTLSAQWKAFAEVINSSAALKWLKKANNGWVKTGPWPTVEQVTYGGNVLEVTEVVDGKAYIRALTNDSTPPDTRGNFYDPSVMHMMGMIRSDGTLEAPSVGPVRMLVMANNAQEKLWIPANRLIQVDAPSVYTPPGTKFTGKITPPGSRLYQFNSKNYFERPGGGPLTLPMSRIRQLGDNLARISWDVLKPFLQRLNLTNKAAVDLIARPDWGPSKGLDGTFIRWIGLLWPGRNVVRIEEVVDGWGRVQGIPLFTNSSNPPGSGAGLIGGYPVPEVGTQSIDLSLYNAYDTPELVHTVYDYNKAQGWGDRANTVYVPILGGPWWVDMLNLSSVENQLPKTVRVTGFPRMNIRSGPGTNFEIIGTMDFDKTIVIQQVVTGKDGIWAKLAKTDRETWLALRHRGVNYTTWKI